MKTLTALTVAAAALGAGAAYAAVKTTKEQRQRFLWDTGDSAVHSLLGVIAKAFPDDGRIPLKQEYITENFFAGTPEFLDKPAKGAKWSLGYSTASVAPTDWQTHAYYIAGYLQFPPNRVEGILDDQCVRAIALNDGSGRGTSVFAVIDCVGISNTDIRRIRARLAAFAKENNINAINISATHCHSAVDTQGLWGELPNALKTNYGILRKGNKGDLISGRDPQFMENLYITAANTIKEAVSGMTKGTLYCAVCSDKAYSRDKRPPYIVEDDITVLRFAPANKSTPTLAVFAAAHPVALGDKNKLISSDYPYYLVDELKKNGYNGMFFQGPQLAIATKGDEVIDEELEAQEELKGYMKFGRGLARYAMSLVGSDKEYKVEPVLNVRMHEIYVPADNELLLLAGRAGLVNNKALRAGKGKLDCEFVTEIGYVQLGENQRFALIPGEFATELYKGGGYGAEESYTKKDWLLAPLTSYVKDGSKLTVIGLCNDSIGYILPENDFGSAFAPLHYEEAVSAGKRSGEAIVKSFAQLVEETSK